MNIASRNSKKCKYTLTYITILSILSVISERSNLRSGPILADLIHFLYILRIGMLLQSETKIERDLRLNAGQGQR